MNPRVDPASSQAPIPAHVLPQNLLRQEVPDEVPDKVVDDGEQRTNAHHHHHDGDGDAEDAAADGASERDE